ncbi:type II toxin-antitoxin system RelE/ParE family toxin [Hyphomonas sp. NPDC076900]|uniref:type II toxin-antitoxin system RelE/ParE family toxin n=1 Tax=unclassified Hyphomonas TaxID=2630699 RepID=UPI003CFD5DB1
MEVRNYVDADGDDRFLDDLKSLPRAAQMRVWTAIGRMELGNLGDHKPLGDSIWEHRIHAESGVRIYFGKVGQEIVLLLTTGLKKTQPKDIAEAKRRWTDHEERQNSP